MIEVTVFKHNRSRAYFLSPAKKQSSTVFFSALPTELGARVVFDGPRGTRTHDRSLNRRSNRTLAQSPEHFNCGTREEAFETVH